MRRKIKLLCVVGLIKPLDLLHFLYIHLISTQLLLLASSDILSEELALTLPCSQAIVRLGGRIDTQPYKSKGEMTIVVQR